MHPSPPRRSRLMSSNRGLIYNGGDCSNRLLDDIRSCLPLTVTIGFIASRNPKVYNSVADESLNRVRGEGGGVDVAAGCR